MGIAFGISLLFSVCSRSYNYFRFWLPHWLYRYVEVRYCVDLDAIVFEINGNKGIARRIYHFWLMQQEFKLLPVLWPPYKHTTAVLCQIWWQCSGSPQKLVWQLKIQFPVTHVHNFLAVPVFCLPSWIFSGMVYYGRSSHAPLKFARENTSMAIEILLLGGTEPDTLWGSFIPPLTTIGHKKLKTLIMRVK
jgi:hypothetical protein